MMHLDLEVCALDADGVGSCGPGTVAYSSPGGAPPAEFNLERVRTAVTGLQNEGLRVLLVSRWELPGPLHEGSQLDVSRLYHVKALNDTVVELIRVAMEYSCPFITNEDVSVLESDWRLPPVRMLWLRNARAQQLHIKFAFNAKGDFGAAFPQQVKSHLARRAAVRRNRVASSVQEDSGSVWEQASEPSAPAQSAPESAAASWLGGLETDFPGTSQRPETHGGPPLHSASAAFFAADEHLAGGNAKAAGGDAAGGVPVRPECNVPPMLTVMTPINGKDQQVLAVLCEDQSAGLFPYALDLSGNIDGTISKSDNRREWSSALAVHGRQWDLPALLLTTERQGMCAIGIGSNAKSRKRAAYLALAVTARARSQSTVVQDPSSDGALQEMVSQVCELFEIAPPVAEGRDPFASHVQTSLCAGVPPPPPPGGPPEGCSLPPPPPEERVWETGPKLESLSQRIVVAKAPYDAEGQGYLSLRVGDRARLGWDLIEPGTTSDLFNDYVYGSLLDPESPCEGWFPLEVVLFEITA